VPAASPDACASDTSLQRLLPQIRDGAGFEFARLQDRLVRGEPACRSIPCRPFVGRLVIALVVEAEPVGQDRLDAWGLDFDGALVLAMDNLRACSTGTFEPVGQGVLRSPCRDRFDAARLLLDDRLRSLPVRGRPVIAIPSCDCLLVAGSDDAAALVALTELAAEALETVAHPLGYGLYCLQDDGWSVFDGDAPATERLRQIRYRGDMTVYDDQKKLLDRIHENENIDLFVASYRLSDSVGTSGSVSSVQWTRGVDALLPRADYLWLYCTTARQIVSVAWDVAMDVLGGLSPEPDLLPERYRVGSFPTDTQMAQLRVRAERIWNVPDRSPT